MLLPTTLPMAISASPVYAARTLTASSGEPVPKATTVSPTTKGDMPTEAASLEAPRTSKSAPPTNKMTPITNSAAVNM